MPVSYKVFSKCGRILKKLPKITQISQRFQINLEARETASVNPLD
jgi:hypothetical protein